MIKLFVEVERNGRTIGWPNLRSPAQALRRLLIAETRENEEDLAFRILEGDGVARLLGGRLRVGLEK